MQNISIKELKKSLRTKQVYNDEITIVANAADAGCYKKKPKVIVFPESEKDVEQLLKLLNSKKVPLTFRGAGTSLSGQAITDSVLMKIKGEYWERTEVLGKGEYVKIRVGKTGGHLNGILKKHHVKFGPDPASVNSATVGGIIANNASGMSCGVHANSYATIQSARIIFYDGILLDTSDKQSCESFRRQKPELIDTILKLKQGIEAKPELVTKIKKKYSIKNTTGYGLNSFIDFNDPIDILLHLMVGSEGTLGFVTEAVFKTVEILDKRASAMVYFSSLKEACKAISSLKSARVSAIELLDREALRSVEGKPGIPEFISEFGKDVSALLIDLESKDEKDLSLMKAKVETLLKDYSLQKDVEFTTDQNKINAYWKIRKGVFPSVGGMRKPGTVVIIEDIAVAEEHISSAVLDLRKLLDDEGYSEAVIYGHAIDGNLHFIFAQDFTNPKELAKYKSLITKLTKLIIDEYDGSLKAEHGTGINMAPFVEYEWGSDLYLVMKELKAAFDPNSILNPGVIINNDKEVHLKNFKSFEPVDELIDKCIECGFCEINCLSDGFTLSARQRIVVQREIQYLNKVDPNSLALRKIRKDFKFKGDQSCAADGLCSITCPLDIDTGKFIKKYRNNTNKQNAFGQKLAKSLAKNSRLLHKVMRSALGFVNVAHSILGSKLMGVISTGIRKISFNKIPQWNKYMARPVRVKLSKVSTNFKGQQKVVYFTSCINQSMGTSKGEENILPLKVVTHNVLEKAGYQVLYPENKGSLCCGMPWESKGFFDVADQKLAELEKALLEVSNNGEYPVICDNSPCLFRMKQNMSKKISLYEPVEFAHDYLLDKLDIQPVEQNYAFHITCSSTKMGLEDKFKAVANACTKNAIFPDEVGCCGFAGDKGFSLPELNNYALRKLKPQVNICEKGYSNSRTCEIGLSKNSGINYKSIIYLIDEVSK